jgi:RNase P subunit RPR2
LKENLNLLRNKIDQLGKLGRINQLINAFGNMPAIYEGIKNRIFKKEDVEEIAAIRWSICKACHHLDIKGNKCTVPGTQPCCTLGGCSIASKTRSLISSCPDGKWSRFLNTEEEAKILRENLK